MPTHRGKPAVWHSFFRQIYQESGDVLLHTLFPGQPRVSLFPSGFQPVDSCRRYRHGDRENYKIPCRFPRISSRRQAYLQAYWNRGILERWGNVCLPALPQPTGHTQPFSAVSKSTAHPAVTSGEPCAESYGIGKISAGFL